MNVGAVWNIIGVIRDIGDIGDIGALRSLRPLNSLNGSPSKLEGVSRSDGGVCQFSIFPHEPLEHRKALVEQGVVVGLDSARTSPYALVGGTRRAERNAAYATLNQRRQ